MVEANKFEITSGVLYDCEALAVLRFRHMHHHFLKPGDFVDISISGVEPAYCLSKVLHNRQETVEEQGHCSASHTLLYCTILY